MSDKPASTNDKVNFFFKRSDIKCRGGLNEFLKTGFIP